MEMEYGDEATRRLHQEGVSFGKGFDKQALIGLNQIKAAVDQRDLAAPARQPIREAEGRQG